MFSCFFVREEENGDEDLLIPSSCDLHFTTLGSNAHGKAVISFQDSSTRVATKPGAVLYVPSLLSHPYSSGVRCKLHVTACRLSWTDREKELDLRPSRGEERRKVNLPSYSTIKSRAGRLMAKYGSCQSPDDLLLYIASTDNLSRVTLNWICRITPSVRPSDPLSTGLVQWFYAALLPAKRTSLHLVMDIPANALLESISPPNSSSRILSQTVTDSNVTLSIGREPVVGDTNGHNETPDILNEECVGVMVSLVPQDIITAESSALLLSHPLCIDDSTKCDGIQSLDALFIPSPPTHFNELAGAEFIFMVDCSGSMSGVKMQNASQSLVLAIKSLPPGCHFNIIAFGSKFRILFHSSPSMPVSCKTVEQGVDFANQLKACLGGTELLSPIQWVLKKSPPTVDATPLVRHFFLITDGGVPNVHTILQLATRHKSNTRFHTFALGVEICSELMLSLSSITEGEYRVIAENDRLQTKVMEVLHLCLLPSLQDVSITFSSPTGYSTIKDHSKESSTLDRVFGKKYHTSHALLQSHSPLNGLLTVPDDQPSVTLSAHTNSLPIDYTAVSKIEREDTASPERRAVILQSAARDKMTALHNKILHQKTCPHHRVHDEAPPPAKATRINGDDNLSDIDQLKEELIDLSIRSNVLFYPYTLLQNEGGDIVCQITPWNSIHHKNSKPNQPIQGSLVGLSVNVPSRKRVRPRPPPSSSSTHSSSLSSLAKQTSTSLTSVAKAAVNIVTFGYVSLEEESAGASGHRIEDQEYYQNEKNRLHWDKNHSLVLPDIYYSTPVQASGEAPIPTSTGGRGFSSSAIQVTDDKDEEDAEDIDDDVLSNFIQPANKQDYYIPLVQMQRPSGEWLLEPALVRLTGVTKKKLSELAAPDDGPLTAHVSYYQIWATALSLAFLKTHCSQFEKEWNLLAFKGKAWLIKTVEENEQLSLSHVERTASQLINN